ncbi:MAG: malonyl-ACP O-methyltransferase BioC [Geobacteraceae bacterium]|nr:malonyl-ACP O-methyltransferase BioC [Geobacteraceae bacterium]
MQEHIDRNRVGRSFHRQAAEYDRYASVQKRVVKRVVSLVKNHVVGMPETVLDIGCGTGHLLSLLRPEFPHSRLYGLDLAYNMTHCASVHLGTEAQFVNADAESLPFRDGAFNLLVSTSTLQWLDNLDLFFKQAHRVTHVNGLLCVAFFGGKTLCELRECYREVLEQRTGGCSSYMDRLHRFMDRADVEHALERIDFDQATILSEIETDYYADVHDLLRSIKRIGAGASPQGDSRGGLGWRGILEEISRLYRNRYANGHGKVPATYEVMYVVARCR